jgi:hypothetical protein
MVSRLMMELVINRLAAKGIGSCAALAGS